MENKKEQEDIFASNKMIAEFMECNMDDEAVIVDSSAYAFDQLKYDFKWDWLMPVCNKIHKDYLYELKVGKTYICGLYDKVTKAILNYNIKATYVAVCHCIEWHNQHTKK